MAKDLIAYDDWMKLTHLMGKPRSKELKALDEEIKRYERFGGSQARWAVQQKLDIWKKSKGSGDQWKLNPRNRSKRGFEELTALLDGKGDSDAAVTASPAFMHADMENARLGVIHLLGHTSVDSNLFNVVLEGGLSAAGGMLGFAGADVRDGGLGSAVAGSVGTNLKTAMIPGKVIFDAAEGAAYPAEVKNPEAVTLWQRFKSWMSDFVSKVLSTLKEKFGDIGPTAAAVKNLVNICAKIFLKAAAPFISAGMDIAKGVVHTLDASITAFRNWRRGKDVVLVKGHPSVIAGAISRAMKLSLAEGLYQTLKGTASAAMAGLSAGVTAIVDVVIALGEMVIKVIWRVVELFRMDRIFEEAASHWRDRGSQNALHRHPIAFGRWFKESSLNLPPVSVLVLNSGICGDKMRFLQMYRDDGDPISQAEFDRGVQYVDGLKIWGASYLKSCGFSFQGKTQFVAKLVDFSQQHTGKKNRAWDIVVKLAKA